MNYWVPWKAMNVLTSWATVRFSRRTLFHWVREKLIEEAQEHVHYLSLDLEALNLPDLLLKRSHDLIIDVRRWNDKMNYFTSVRLWFAFLCLLSLWSEEECLFPTEVLTEVRWEQQITVNRQEHYGTLWVSYLHLNGLHSRLNSFIGK
jgi:hypothetical protein